MALSALSHIRRVANTLSLSVAACVACLCIGSPVARSQQERGVAVEGYITALHAPAGFEINGKQVITTPSTGYRLLGEKKSSIDSPLREATQIGAYVLVEGPVDKRTNAATARTIVFRDDWDQSFNGVGIIDKVASVGAQPVFRADGYLIRISATTKCNFHGDLKSLSDIGTNTWMRYRAKRGKDGLLNASNVDFFSGRVKAARHTPDAQTVEMDFVAPDLDRNLQGRVNLGMLGKPHPILADTALQTRVMRVGSDVVPEFQKAMTDTDRFKIAFRFYAIDNEPSCIQGCVLHGGLILISTQTVERLKNDSQLGAVLAECVVRELQHQAAGVLRGDLLELGAAAAVDAGVIGLSPLIVAPLVIETSVVKAEIEKQEQRGRLALAILDDAGYDPWQAPEAWRLVEPKQLPQDLNSLKYPYRSQYQLGILNLEYRRTSSSATPAPATPASAEQN